MPGLCESVRSGGLPSGATPPVNSPPRAPTPPSEASSVALPPTGRISTRKRRRTAAAASAAQPAVGTTVTQRRRRPQTLSIMKQGGACFFGRAHRGVDAGGIATAMQSRDALYGVTRVHIYTLYRVVRKSIPAVRHQIFCRWRNLENSKIAASSYISTIYILIAASVVNIK